MKYITDQVTKAKLPSQLLKYLELSRSLFIWHLQLNSTLRQLQVYKSCKAQLQLLVDLIHSTMCIRTTHMVDMQQE